ncbi:hypothetical protein FRB99_005150 [Tulasnella sp. 403]|nr:hypothetical protein FRB99_005150 [Tulasnella sp. 403]
MSADVIHPNTIDLTDEPDTPPGRTRRSSTGSDDIVFISSTFRSPPQRVQRELPPNGRLRLPPRPGRIPDIEMITIPSDSEDELDPPPNRNAGNAGPPPNAFRIFSPPATFAPSRDQMPHAPPRRDAPPPILPLPRIGLGGGLMAIRNHSPASRYHSQDAARRMGNVPPAGPSQASRRSTIFENFWNFIGGGMRGPTPAEVFMGIDAERPRPAPQQPLPDRMQEINIPPFGGMVWNPTGYPEVAGRNFHWRALGAGWGPPEPPKPKPSYQHSMTHGPSPRPGFTFDLDPEAASASAPIVIDDEELPKASSSAQDLPTSTPKLICARCPKPLLMGSRTMWGLRCGHVICRDCLDNLSIPLPGKGKEKEQDIPDIKPESPATTRSSRARPTSLPSTRQLRASTKRATEKSVITASSPKKRRYSKAFPKPGTIGEEYEYFCPVCPRSHWSVKTWQTSIEPNTQHDVGEWVWKQKDRLGAIPIFT